MADAAVAGYLAEMGLESLIAIFKEVSFQPVQRLVRVSVTTFYKGTSLLEQQDTLHGYTRKPLFVTPYTHTHTQQKASVGTWPLP
jgi:hypothetical protein